MLRVMDRSTIRLRMSRKDDPGDGKLVCMGCRDEKLWLLTRILGAFREKIHRDAEARAAELNRSLSIYVKGNPQWKKKNRLPPQWSRSGNGFEEQIMRQPKTLLNRLLTNDLVFDWDPYQTDYLQQFLDEYDINYRRTANSGTTLKALVYTSKINKDTKGADKLLEHAI